MPRRPAAMAAARYDVAEQHSGNCDSPSMVGKMV